MASSFAAAGFLPTNTPIKPMKNSFPDKPDVISLNAVPKPNKTDTKASMKAQAQTIPKINGTNPGVKLPFENVLLDEEPHEKSSSPLDTPIPSSPFQMTPSKTFYNALPDWSVLLAAMMSYIFLAAEKQFTLSDWKPKRPDMLADAFGFGRMIQDGTVFRQTFPIRSYEIGADRTASIETLMNHLQVQDYNGTIQIVTGMSTGMLP
jgi:fatty acyl-ACP thioesterase B